ncbi:hypothetical protein M2146_002553 [Lachnospiraceae bacterium PF1-22]
MGFLQTYKAVTLFTPKHFTIIDFGCYLAAQSYYFEDYKEYIGVDVVKLKRFTPQNATHIVSDIESFINEHAHEFDLDQTLAICSYVPDRKATKLVRETFPNTICFYPSHADSVEDVII